MSSKTQIFAIFFGSEPERGPLAGQGGSKRSGTGMGAGEAMAMVAARREVRRRVRKCILKVKECMCVGGFEGSVFAVEEWERVGKGRSYLVECQHVLLPFKAVAVKVKVALADAFRMLTV